VVPQTEASYRPGLFMLKLPKETFVYICNKVIGYWKQKGTKELLKLYRVLAWMLRFMF